MAECIRKFDEDLSLKASKCSLDLVKKEIEASYIHNQYKNDISKIFLLVCVQPNKYILLSSVIDYEFSNIYQILNGLEELIE